jgi:hypothetical protein
MEDRSGAKQVRNRAAAWSLGWAFAAALYLLLIDTTDAPELIVGAGAAVIAATGFELARERDVTGLATKARWVLRMYRPILRVPGDVVVVSRAVLRQLVCPRGVVGVFRAVPFCAVEGEALESGRRALAESFGSLAPNTIIIGVDADRKLLLGHQLRRSGGTEAVDVLRLG